MKKLISFLLAAIMLLILFVPAYAVSFTSKEKDGGMTYFSIGDVMSSAGAEVTVPVTITGDFHCHGLNLNIEYDASKLTVVKCKGGNLFANRPEDAMVFIDYTSSPGQVIIGGIMPTYLWEGEGVLSNITFRVNEDCTSDQPLHFVLVEYYALPIGGELVDLMNTAVLQDGMIHLLTQEYNVTFKDWDGTVLKTQTVMYGGSATPPPDPTRYGYTFTGWDVPFDNITSDLIVTAQYRLNTYTVRFRDWNGTVLKTETVEHGSAAVPPPDPSRYGYTFTGWDLPFDNVVSNLNVTAQYIINTYTVTFVGAYSGTVQVTHGSTAELPVLDSDSMHYTFTLYGEPWDGTNVVSDLTIVVDLAINVYTVTFLDTVDDAVIKTEEVLHGNSASAPDVPQHYGYTFEGWDTPFDRVTENTTVNTVYEPIKFTVIFVDGFDNVICVLLVPYLSAAAAPEPPETEGWEFTGWDQDFSCVTHDMIINAVWDRIYLTVTFVGAYTGTELVEYGDDCPLPVYQSEMIHYTFSVDGQPWNGKCIKQSVTVLVGAALNSETFFTVTFLAPDGSVIDEQTVTYGTAAEAPVPPEITHYKFYRWDKDFSRICEDLTVTAEYLLRADVDFNGFVDTADALHILRCALRLEEFDEMQSFVGDVDDNVIVDTADAMHALRIALRLE